MIVKTFPVGPFQCNCTILGDEQTAEAIVIDPGDQADLIIQELKKDALKVKYIIHTHAHIDHIGATCKVKEETNGKIALHKEDLFLYNNITMQGEFLGMKVDSKVPPVDHYLVEGNVLEWGKENRAEVLHTPGHTPGSVSFVMKELYKGKDVLFSGDTLFMGSIGRTDLWGGDFNQIIDSIKTKLLTFEDDIVVVPGHGPGTSIGQERKMNPFLVNG